ncbi:MAG: hypothetical protein A3A73_03990 [Omnitrophica bacterium RIFCSPLOWO2_01_FULL_50_24]|nr:MAG: hypothetical protein A3A73_03990 [Omnitrophica bacterium RIFCSPLOWO2_01_FULL_50_24]
MARKGIGKASRKVVINGVKKGFRFLWTGIPFVIFFFTLWLVSFGVKHMLHADPYFQISRVTVFPSSILTHSEYRYLDEVTRGKSLVEVNIEHISRVLERNAKVERAEVRRQFPKELEVVITERKPWILVRFKKSGSWYAVGNDQIVTGVLREPISGLLVLDDEVGKQHNLSPGGLYENPYFGDLTQLFKMIRSESALRRETVSRMNVDRLGHWTLVLKDALEVHIGRPTLLAPAKSAVLKAILESKERDSLAYVDTRYPDIVVKKKK